jgi:transglutaminase-like putative cysteine protease
VLVDFDGATWTMRAYSSQGAWTTRKRARPIVRGDARAAQQDVALRARRAGLGADGTQLLSDLQMRYRRPIAERMRYEMTSYLELPLRRGRQPAAARTGAALRRDAQPARWRWAAVGGENPDPAPILQRPRQFFGTGFTYTLGAAAARPPNPLRRLRFNSRQGFCEHFSGAFTLLMRAAGVPRAW